MSPVEQDRWQDRGVCRSSDTSVFFAEDRSEALRLCAGCPVRADCYEHALSDPSLDGIWGGTTPELRAAVRAGRLSPLAEVLWELTTCPNVWARVGYGPEPKLASAVEELRRDQSAITGVRFEVRLTSSGDGHGELFARYVPGLVGLRII